MGTIYHLIYMKQNVCMTNDDDQDEIDEEQNKKKFFCIHYSCMSEPCDGSFTSFKN